MRFSTFSFFHHSNQPGPLINGLTYFRVFLTLVSKKVTHLGITSRRVMFWRIFYWLAVIWYPGEIDLLRCHTLGRLTHWGIIPREDWLAGLSYPQGDWLAGVSYPGETDSLGYDTPGSQIFELKIRITWRILNQNQKMLIRWSVAQEGSNYERKKTGGQKSC